MSGARGAASGIGLYDRIYNIVDQVPVGRVVTYGQIAEWAGHCTPRTVGYAMAALPPWRSSTPWHRVVNSQGRVSPRRSGTGSRDQRARLTAEQIEFDARGRIDLARFGWSGPAPRRRRTRGNRADR